MADYDVLVRVDGVGRMKIRAESESQAKEDARQMAIEDVEWDNYDIVPFNIAEEDK